MIDFDPVAVLQAKNAFISLINLAALGVFVTILISDRDNFRDVYWRALALVALYFLGEGSEQIWYWAWRHFGHGNPLWLTDWRIVVVLAFNVLIAASCVGIIRMFTRERFGSRMWIAVTGICLLLTAASFFVPRV
jgi:hypothetical protein